MDPVTGVDTTATAQAAAGKKASADNAIGRLDSDAFLQLFVAQLKYQNPMEPQGAAEMMQQTAQFTQVEMLQRVVEAQQEMLGMQQISTAAALVGKQVDAEGPQGRVTGVVDGYRSTADGVVLLVGDQQLPLELAASVGAAPAAATPSPTAATPPPTATEPPPTATAPPAPADGTAQT